MKVQLLKCICAYFRVTAAADTNTVITTTTNTIDTNTVIITTSVTHVACVFIFVCTARQGDLCLLIQQFVLKAD